MGNSWAIPAQPADGTDLLLELAPGLGVRAGLVTALRDAVRTGRLTAGTRLPSSRSLARDLGMARNTVADAYGQLVAEGWLTARQGAGTRVADRAVFAQAGVVARAAEPAAPRFAYDLVPGTPDLSAFPRAAWLAATRRALTSVPNDAFGYGDPRGRPELRRALAEYLARSRGVRATPERILVCSGYIQGLAVLCAALREAGATTLAVEALGLGVHRAVVRAQGLAMAPLAVDGSGARTPDLYGTRADAVLLTPSHQFPTGVALRPDRRTVAVAWAGETGGLVIEDDYDGEFRYDRQPVGALQGLDPERVVYAGTASKSLGPGLRLAWLVLPQSLLDPVVEAKRVADGHTGVIDQLALAELITCGDYDRHVRRSRVRYRRRRDRLVAALAQRAPGIGVTGIAAGLHALLELPAGIDEQDVVRSGAARGVRLHGLAPLRYGPADEPTSADAPPPAGGPLAADVPPSAGGSGPSAIPDPVPGLVVGYGTPPDHAFTGALDALCEVLVGLRG